MSKQNDLTNREFEKWAKQYPQGFAICSVKNRDGVAVVNKKKNRQAPCLHF